MLFPVIIILNKNDKVYYIKYSDFKFSTYCHLCYNFSFWSNSIILNFSIIKNWLNIFYNQDSVYNFLLITKLPLNLLKINLDLINIKNINIYFVSITPILDYKNTSCYIFFSNKWYRYDVYNLLNITNHLLATQNKLFNIFFINNNKFTLFQLLTKFHINYDLITNIKAIAYYNEYKTLTLNWIFLPQINTFKQINILNLQQFILSFPKNNLFSLNFKNQWLKQNNYGLILMDHLQFMFDLRVFKTINFKYFLRPKLKIQILEHRFYKTSMSNLCQAQKVDYYYFYFVDSNYLCNIQLNKNVLLDINTNEKLNTNRFSFKTLNYNNLSSDFDFNINLVNILFLKIFDPTFFQFFLLKWKHRILLNHGIRVVNIWPSSVFFQSLRSKFSVIKLQRVYRLGFVNHYVESIMKVRLFLRTILYEPLFFWLHNSLYWKQFWVLFKWKNRLHWYLWFNNFIYYYFNVNLLLQSEDSKKVLFFICIRIPYIISAFLNYYWISVRYFIFEYLVEKIWRSGDGLSILIPMWCWFWGLTGFKKFIIYVIGVPFHVIYMYISGFFSIYLNIIYPFLCLKIWFILTFCTRYLQFFFSFSLYTLKLNILVFSKVFFTNLNVLVEVYFTFLGLIIWLPISSTVNFLRIKKIFNFFFFNINSFFITSIFRFFFRQFIEYYNIIQNLNKFYLYLFFKNYLSLIVYKSITISFFFCLTVFLNKTQVGALSINWLFWFLDFCTLPTQWLFFDKCPIVFNYTPVNIESFFECNTVQSEYLSTNVNQINLVNNYTFYTSCIIIISITILLTIQVIDYTTIYNTV